MPMTAAGINTAMRITEVSLRPLSSSLEFFFGTEVGDEVGGD
jgi:hypothetical protein